jgi:hypothetical protein
MAGWLIDEFERIWKEFFMAESRYNSKIRLERLRKILRASVSKPRVPVQIRTEIIRSTSVEFYHFTKVSQENPITPCGLAGG